MGKVLSILVVIWLVGLVVCLFQAVHWNGVADDLVMEWYEIPPDDRYRYPEEALERQDAARRATNWTTGAFAWGLFGAILLGLVWRWERRQDEPAVDWAQ